MVVASTIFSVSCSSAVKETRGAGSFWAHAWAHVIVRERRKDIVAKLGDFERDGDLTFVALMKGPHTTNVPE